MSIQVDQRLSVLQRVVKNFTTDTAYSNSIAPLLIGLRWSGEARHLAEVLPHFEKNLDLYDFLTVFSKLHYEHKTLKKINITELDSRLLPCLFVTDTGETWIALSKEGDVLTVFDGEKAQERSIQAYTRGTAYFFSQQKEELAAIKQQVSWFKRTIKRYKKLLYPILLLSFFMNLLALGVPLFIMVVYDKVVLSESKTMLVSLIIGVGIAVVGIWILTAMRTKILAFIGARLDVIMGTAIFERLLYLPPSYTETAGVGSQISRLKDFEVVREFMTGPMLSIVFEFPFVIIFLAAIGFLGGVLIAVPLALLFLYVLIALCVKPLIRRSVIRNSQANTKRQSFLIEALTDARAIKYSGAETTWLKRYEKIAADTNIANFRASMVTSITNTISDILMLVAGMSTITLGVFLVLNQTLTAGALIASMIFVWRVLGPFRAVFSTLSRFDQIRASIQQINMLMNLNPERNPDALLQPLTNVRGDIKFTRVGMRYANETEPALSNISFEVKQGQVAAIIGRNGAGKSTLIKLIANLYPIQSGSIRLDDHDIRQIDPVELRHAIGYLPQKNQLFYGTIAQNLRLANPVATDEDMKEACELAGLYEDIMALPEKFDTRLADQWDTQLSESFQQRLSLARVYVKKAAVLLFDEPVNALAPEVEDSFVKALGQLRGKSTIFIVTHRPSHLQYTDKIILLHEGGLIAEGPTAELRPKLPKEFL